MSAHVLLIFLNKLWKRSKCEAYQGSVKMLGLLSILSLSQ